MKKSAIVAACLALYFILWSFAVPEGQAVDQYRSWTGGVYTLAAGDTVSLYPCFSYGGGGLRAGADYTSANGCGPCQTGFLLNEGANTQVQFWGGSSIDTSSFYLPNGSPFKGFPVLDSVKVRNIGSVDTELTWGFWR